VANCIGLNYKAEIYAEFITRACNSHEELVEAVHKARGAAQIMMTRDPTQTGMWDTLERELTQALIKATAPSTAPPTT